MISALGRHLADSTAFALVIALLCVCLRRRGPATRHALWLMAAAKFALPVALLSRLGESLRGLLPHSQLPAAVPAMISHWVISPVVSGPASGTGDSFRLLSLSLIGMWMAGSAIALGVWLRRLRESWKRSARCGNCAEASFLRLKQRMGLRMDVQLKVSDDVSEPALAGFRRPSVMIPAGLARQLSSSELEAVILHELAHARRWDNWTAAFAHSVSCVFWFYPLVWWIERQLHRERELACDEMVIRCGAAAEDYTAGILKVCRFHLNQDVAGVSAVCGSSLKRRMEAIMSLSVDTPNLRAPKVVIATLAAMIAGVPLLIGLLSTTGAPAAYAAGQNGTQSAKRAEPRKAITCVAASVDYPEGTVIQEGDGVEQMCVRVAVPRDARNPEAGWEYVPSWVVTSDAARQRSATIVHLPEPPPFYCTPAPPTERGLCTCEEGAGPFSPGAQVNSAKGAYELRCDHGKWAQTSIPNRKK